MVNDWSYNIDCYNMQKLLLTYLSLPKIPMEFQMILKKKILILQEF